jgi:hypothetical protein
LDVNRELGTPLIVLLDQRDWIGLAQASKGHASAGVYNDLLSVCRSLKPGATVFPLTSVRYLETSNTGKLEQRRDLAMIMEEVSDFRSMAPVEVLMWKEIETFLARHIGIAVPYYSIVPLLGEGVGFAFGVNLNVQIEGLSALEPKIERELLTAVDGAFRNCWRDVGERMVLARESPAMSMKDTWQDFGRNFEREENAFEDRARSWDPNRVVDAAFGNTYGIHNDVYFDVAVRHGVAEQYAGLVSRWAATSKEQVLELAKQVPTIDVLANLRAQKIRNAGRRWVANDWADVAMLRAGIPYADIVSIDKYWADLVSRTDMSDRYSTAVVGRPSALVELLRPHAN